MSKILTSNVRLEDLELGVFTPRISYDQRYLDELAEDMQMNGQHKPIICTPHPTKPEKYIVVDGEYRVRAAKKLGWFTIRAEVRMLTEEEALLLALTINEMHGKRLDTVEEAMHISKMIEKYGYTETEVARKLRKSQSWVSERLGIIKRSAPEVKEHLIARAIKTSHAREIVEKLPPEKQREAVKEVVEHNLSVRATEALAEALKVAETEEEKQKILEVIPKLEPKKAKALVETLEKAEPTKRIEILSQPLELYAETYKPIEEFEKAATTPPEKPVIEFFTCQCGRRYVIDWVSQKITETGAESGQLPET